MLMKKTELEKKLQAAGLAVFESVPALQPDELEETIYLAKNTLDELLRFAKLQGISCVFYVYSGYDPEAYVIDLDEFDLPEPIHDLLEEDVLRHNMRVLNADYQKPAFLLVYCLYEGHILAVKIMDDWLEKQGIYPAGETIMRLVEQHKDDLLQLNDELFEEEEEVRDLILADVEFYNCKTKQLRKQYAERFMEKHPQYSPIFPRNGREDVYNKTEFFDFIEYVWQERKGRPTH